MRPLDGITDPLASLDASIKGTLSSGNVSLLKPWGQPIPEVQFRPQTLPNTLHKMNESMHRHCIIVESTPNCDAEQDTNHLSRQAASHCYYD